MTLLVGAIAGALAGHAILAAVGPGLSAHAMLVWGPAALILMLLAAARFGTWQGPVVFSAPDVALLLAAPIALADLVRPRLDRAFVVGAILGLLVGAGVLLLLAGGPASAGLARSACGLVGLGALGLLGVAASWLVQSSRRASGALLRATPAVALAAGALLLAADGGSLGRSVAVWSGPWGWAIAPFAGVKGWPFAVALTVSAAAAASALARRRAGAASAERFLARAETRAGLTASAMTLDYRQATLTRRAATAGGLPRPLRVRRPRRGHLVVLWRDALALIRSPSRAAWATLLCAGATLEAVGHPGRLAGAALAAAPLYLAASILCEPLRIDVDQPDKSRLLLSWSFARVLVAHCALPALALLAIASSTIVAAAIAEFAGSGALALIPTVLPPIVAGSVLCAALTTRRGGQLDVLALLSSDPSNPFGGIMVVFGVAPWLLVNMVAISVPLLLLGYATSHHRAVLAAGLLALSLSGAVLAALLAVARRSTPRG